MDRTTKWLLRTASLVVILSGIGGLSFFAISSGFIKNLKIESLKLSMGKKKVPNKITKRGNCPKTHNYNIGNFCMNEKGYETFEKEQIT